MISRFRALLKEPEAGFGLAELAVYAVMSVIILAISASIFISTTVTRVQVTELTAASGTGQLIANSVEEGVRNASGPLGVTDPVQKAGIKAELPTATGQLLRARVAVGTLNGSIVWQCQGWFFSPDTHAVYASTNDSAAIVDPVSFSVVNGTHTPADSTDHWALLGEGVRLPSGVTTFFGAGLDRVVLRFEVTSENVSLILIPSTVVRRTTVAGGTGPSTCY